MPQDDERLTPDKVREARASLEALYSGIPRFRKQLFESHFFVVTRTLELAERAGEVSIAETTTAEL